MQKNPYLDHSPEWQLFERAKSEELKAQAFAADIVRYTMLEKKARESAGLFWEALEILKCVASSATKS